MGEKSAIEWTDASWSPIRARNRATGKVGWHCEHATTGCEFCYAETINKRLGTGLPFKPGHRKDIEIFLDEKMLLAPLHWKKPRKIFVCSMTDLFADFVKDEWIDRVFAVMALSPQHTFQVLTKRPERMLRHVTRIEFGNEVEIFPWPLPNVWLGVSCERQQEADERIPSLLQTPAAVLFVSCEPLLGPIDLTGLRNHNANLGEGQPWLNAIGSHGVGYVYHGRDTCSVPRLDWVIVGGESGPKARPMHPNWARSLRDQCAAAGVAFFFKQWGEHQSVNIMSGAEESFVHERVGKKAAGRRLDGREWNEFPGIA